MEGFLLHYEKKKNGRKWIKRYVILHKSRLTIYKDNSCTKHIHGLSLQRQGCTVTQVHDPSCKTRSFIEIAIRNSKDLEQFTTDEPLSFNDWFDALFKALTHAQSQSQDPCQVSAPNQPVIASASSQATFESTSSKNPASGVRHNVSRRTPQRSENSMSVFRVFGAMFQENHQIRNLDQTLPNSVAVDQKVRDQLTQPEHHRSLRASMQLVSRGSQFTRTACNLRELNDTENHLSQAPASMDQSDRSPTTHDRDCSGSSPDIRVWCKDADWPVGRGSCGTVYRGVIKDKGKPWQKCAIKVIKLPTEAGAIDGQSDRIRLTVDGEQNLCELSHPNVVKFLGIEQAKQFKVLLFMELLVGDTLESVINGQPMADQRQVVSFCSQICSALQYIHSRQPPVIHRDINGCNIMVMRRAYEQQQTVKLIDFGLSLKLKAAASHDSTTSAVPKGTVNFLAPELLAAESDLDRARYSTESDIWAFGCAVYQMVTGCRPHSDCPNMLSMARRLDEHHGAPDLPKDAAISNELREFYSRCTAWHRMDRWSAERLLGHGFLAGRGSPGIVEPMQDDEEAAFTNI